MVQTIANLPVTATSQQFIIKRLICSLQEKLFTIDGFEAHFGVNYLANFVIVKGLIDNVKKSGRNCYFVSFFILRKE